jgi:hypothetical protein
MKHLKVFALQVAVILTVGLIALSMGGCGDLTQQKQARQLERIADALERKNPENGKWYTFTAPHSGVFDSLSLWIVTDSIDAYLVPGDTLHKDQTYWIKWGPPYERSPQ